MTAIRFLICVCWLWMLIPSQRGTITRGRVVIVRAETEATSLDATEDEDVSQQQQQIEESSSMQNVEVPFSDEKSLMEEEEEEEEENPLLSVVEEKVEGNSSTSTNTKTQQQPTSRCWGCDHKNAGADGIAGAGTSAGAADAAATAAAPDSTTSSKSTSSSFSNRVHPHSKLTVPSGAGAGGASYHKYNAASATFSTSDYRLPPEGFQITAAVYTGNDGLSYFWMSNNGNSKEARAKKEPTGASSISSDSKNATTSSNNTTDATEEKDEVDHTLSSTTPLPLVPFLECNAVGSTTAPLPIKHGLIRHFPCGADPKNFVTTPHPGQLLVALSDLEIVVSGHNEQSHRFSRGSVILLEDTMGKGHKIRAACGGGDGTQGNHPHDDMTVLLLTLVYPPGHESPHPQQAQTHGHHPAHGQPFLKKTTTSGKVPTSTSSGSHGGGFAGGWSTFKSYMGMKKKEEGGGDDPCLFETDPSFSSSVSADILNNGSNDQPSSSMKKFVQQPQISKDDLLMTGAQHRQEEANPATILDFWGEASNTRHPTAKRVRRFALVGVGSALSVMGSIWLSKVAPIVVTLVFGGGCLAVGSTCAIVVGGDKLFEETGRLWKQYQYDRKVSKQYEEDATTIDDPEESPTVDDNISTPSNNQTATTEP